MLLAEIDKVITGGTVMVTVVVELQAPVVPVTVYVVVIVGEAVTLVPEVPLNPKGGVHEYVLAPLPVKVTLAPPTQYVLEEAATEVLTVMTLTVAVAELVQAPVAPTMV